MLLSGIASEIGALMAVGVMIGAVFVVHWPHGYFAQNGGFEYPLNLIIFSLAIIIGGPGVYALWNPFKHCRKIMHSQLLPLEGFDLENERHHLHAESRFRLGSYAVSLGKQTALPTEIVIVDSSDAPCLRTPVSTSYGTAHTFLQRLCISIWRRALPFRETRASH